MEYYRLIWALHVDENKTKPHFHVLTLHVYLLWQLIFEISESSNTGISMNFGLILKTVYHMFAVQVSHKQQGPRPA